MIRRLFAGGNAQPNVVAVERIGHGGGDPGREAKRGPPKLGNLIIEHRSWGSRFVRRAGPAAVVSMSSAPISGARLRNTVYNGQWCASQFRLLHFRGPRACCSYLS